MKKTILVLLGSLILIAGLSGEGQQDDATLRIGISQFVQHPALDAVSQGIMDEMKKLGYTAEFIYENSNGDGNTAKQIASLFKTRNLDMVVGVGTPNAQALKQSIKDIPVIYAAISDPISAGLVDSLYEGEAGITGTSHQTPIREQLEFLMTLMDLKTVGQVYSGNDDSAMYQADQTRKACEALDLTYVSTSVSNSSEVKQATQTLMGRVDAIYVSTDNTVVSALGGLSSTALENKVPVLSADPSSAKETPVLAAWGFNWYYIGQRTALMMDEVLKGKDMADMPTGIVSETENMDLVLNMAVADLLGMEIPQEYIDKASLVITE